jgi:endoglucanase
MTKYRFIALFAASTSMFACGSADDSNVQADMNGAHIDNMGIGTTPGMLGTVRNQVSGAAANGDPAAPADPGAPAPAAAGTQASSLYTTGVKYRGINQAGAEYGDDWYGWTGNTFYKWPSATDLGSELAYLDAAGFNTVRLPISWERLQHSLGGELNATYVAALKSTVAQMTAAGFQVIVDLHNYNRYATGAFTDDQGTTQKGGYVQHVYGDGTLTNAHVNDVWTRLATMFKDDQRVVFELMNESHDFPITSDAYFALVNEQIAAVRATGATNLVIVPNSRASDITHWATTSPNGGSLDSVAALTVTDPANNYAFVVHQYDASPASPTAYAEMLATVTAWARTNGKRLFLTELGVVPTSGNAKAALTNALQYMNDNADVWLGWTPWNLAPFSLTSATNNADGPQSGWYAPFLVPGTATAGK